MTFRSIALGLLLGLGLPLIDNFNSGVVRQTIYLIGNQFPTAIFGVLLLLLLVWNPLARRIRGSWALGAGELAVMAALALAVCGWPGSNFFRTFTTTLAMPSHLLKSKAGWQSADVLSYLPGGSPELAEGQIRDWPKLAAALVQAGSGSGDPVGKRVWALIPAETQNLLRTTEGDAWMNPALRRPVLEALNGIIALPEPLDRETKISEEPAALVNRRALERLFADSIIPAPSGEGVLLANGRPDPRAVDVLIQGSTKPMGLFDLPWDVWWPSLRLWAGLGLVFAIGSLCMALVVHPQWSKRELLPYPIPRFLQEITQPSANGKWPQVAYSKLFWIGFGVMVAVHLMNGLNAWFPGVVKVPLQYDFDPLKQLFPDAAKIDGSQAIFKPTIFPCVVAFAFFLSTEVSFSLGILGFVWLALGGFLISQGIPVTGQGLQPGNFSLMIFGGYVAFTVMLLFIGRHYYWNVAGSALGMRRRDLDTPGYATWGARGMLLCAIIAAFLLKSAGLDWFLSVLLVGMVLMIFLIVSRIYAETGALMIQAGWGPATMLVALLGAESIGPTAAIVLGIAGTILVVDTRETWMAFFTNGLQMTSSTGNTAPQRIAPWLLLMLVLGLAATLGTKFLSQYNEGLSYSDRWATEWVPSGPFNQATTIVSELSAQDSLASSVGRSGLDRLAVMAPTPHSWMWVGLGAVLVAGCSFARLRLAWWPIHPILFLVWGTWAGYRVTISFLLGWLIKVSVTKLAGAKAFHSVKPLMVGIIAGELLSAIAWIAVGWIYYAQTGIAPKSPSIFP